MLLLTFTIFIHFQGGLAGMTAWTAIFPCDTIKSRMQAGPGTPSFTEAAKANFKEAGARGFYRGLSACLMRAYPANAALFWGVHFADGLLKGEGEVDRG